MSRVEVILKATDILTTLSDIDIRELLPYQNKLEDASKVLQRSVEAVKTIQRQPQQSGSTSLISSSAPRSPRLDTGPQNTNSSHCSHRPTQHGDEIDVFSKRNESPRSGALNLLLVLENGKRSKKIWDYLSTPGRDPVNGSELFDWTEEDPRVIDLRLSSSSNPSFDVKFRRGLSQRSLAAEYDEWEKATFNTSRILELSQNPAISDHRKGHIDHYLQVNIHRFKDQKSTRHGIKHGIRLLVFETIYGHVGISAILILVYSAFRSVKYKEHFWMKRSLEDTAWESLAKDKSSWLTQCQGQYDEKVRMWEQHQASWRATYRKAKRQRTAGASCQAPTLHHGRTLNSTIAQGDHPNRCLEETQTLPNELGGVSCTPTALDPSFPAQPVNCSFLSTAHEVQTQPGTTSSVLDPSSHVGNVDIAFPELAGLHDSTSIIGNGGCSQPLYAFSSFDPSTHAQNVHFTMLDPSEHVQAYPLCTSLMPATADPSLEPQNTIYPISNTADYDPSTLPRLAAHQLESRPQEFTPPEYTSDQHIHSMERMEHVVPEVESRPQQMNAPNDTDCAICSQPTDTWRLGYHAHNFMVPA